MTVLNQPYPSIRPRVDCDLPGPRSAELLERQRRRESNARVYPRHLPIAIAEGSGSFVTDVDGNVFIDFLTGAGVLSLGHNHPELVHIVTEQLGRLTHGLDFPTPAKDAFTDAQLSMLAPNLRNRMKLHFCGPTGANAVEAAVKLCKTATGRGDIISFQGGFHGSSHAAMALTGLVAQKQPVPNGVPGIHFFPYSYCGRCPMGLTPDTCETNCVGYLERALRDSNGGIPLPAAVVVEMVQGEGGVVPARTDFVRRVRALTRELDIPLVIDEVQTGCGRTGTWFAFEQYDIEPDVIIVSKALSGIGIPVALILYDERLDSRHCRPFVERRRLVTMVAEQQQPVWRVLLGYVRPFRRVLVAGALLSLVTGASGLALPLVVRELIGGLQSGHGIVGLLVLMSVLVLANAAIGAFGSFLLGRTAESVVLFARRQLVARLLWLRIPAVDAAEPGDLMSRVTSDTTLLRQVTTGSLVSTVTSTLTLIATVILMALLDPLLLAVTLTALSLAQVVVRILVPRIRRATKQAQDSVGAMGSALERVLGALRTVKASGAEQREHDRLNEAAAEAWRGGVRAAKWQAIAGNTGGLAIQVSFIIVLGLGGARVASGAIDVGTLVAFLLYLFYLLPPMRDLVNAVLQYQVGSAAVARIREVEALPAEPSDPPTTEPAPDPRPASVEFEQVRFRYRPELPEVHHGVSFTVPAGGMTAFVGPSGAGKTTVFSMIERFYEPDSGRILVDGTDVADWPLAQLRAAIGYVEQDAPVLSGTLRENLLFGAPHANEADVQEVLVTTRLDGMVARLPDGLDTTVGHRGIKLSGGERQRIAIARALLRRPRLLLLDEVTSQLDAVNEAALRETIADAAHTTTVLVVAHRLSTVTMADRIVVMDAGQVRAVGSHTDLVAADPLYAELAATQLLATAD